MNANVLWLFLPLVAAVLFVLVRLGHIRVWRIRAESDLVESVALGRSRDGHVPIRVTLLSGRTLAGRLTVPVAVDVSRKLMIASANAVTEEREAVNEH